MHIWAKKMCLFKSEKRKNCRCKKPRVEVEGKREGQSRKQHQDMVKILLKQTKQQQEQMQSFQQMSTSMQRQQSQIIMKLLERKNNFA